MRQVLWIWTSIVLVASLNVFAEESKDAEAGKEVPCAVLEKFDGEVQILDPTRTHLVATSIKSPVPCGGWVTVQKGWALLKHRQGYHLKLSESTFAEIYDNENNQFYTAQDHVTLYKGKIFAKIKNGMNELRISTPNARMRMKAGMGIALFNQVDQESQLLVLDEEGTIENRFESSRRRLVKEGEAASLNFQTMRVVPTEARSLQLASLKETVLDLSLDPKDLEIIFKKAKGRNERTFAANLSERSPASTKINGVYVRHLPADPKEDAKAEKHFERKLAGGESMGKNGFFQKSDHPVKLAERVDEKRNKFKEEEDAERNRLLQELGNIRY